MLKNTKKRGFKLLANQWSFRITVIALVAFILWCLVVTDHRNTTWVYYLIPFLVVSFILAAIGLTLDKKDNKRLVIRSIISLFLSLILISLIGYIYISPVLFPFGIPPL